MRGEGFRLDPAVPGRGSLSVLLALGCALLPACEPTPDEEPEEAASERTGQPAAGPLLDPRAGEMNRTAPASYRAVLETSRGEVVLEVEREWAPNGADRFYNLVRGGFYDGARFFRVIPGFVAQFGLSGDPAVDAAWEEATIPDDSVRESNERGTLVFAASGPDSRTTQIFINLADNERLDDMGFAPIGRVAEGMDVVDELYAGYGEGPPQGTGPRQDRIRGEGNDYLEEEFPSLDRIEEARIAGDEAASEGTARAEDGAAREREGMTVRAARWSKRAW